MYVYMCYLMCTTTFNFLLGYLSACYIYIPMDICILFSIASQNVIEVWVGGYLVICQIAQTYTGALLM